MHIQTLGIYFTKANPVGSATFLGSVAYYSSCRCRKVMIQVTNVGHIMFYEGIFYTSVEVVSLDFHLSSVLFNRGFPGSHNWQVQRGSGTVWTETHPNDLRS